MVENELEASFYSWSEVVAENGVSPTSNYGEAVVGLEVYVTGQLRIGLLVPSRV